MPQSTFPSLALAEWQPTHDTIHSYAQLLGRIRRALAPRQKHWWHISLRVTATGLTTTPMPADDEATFEMLLDFTGHQLRINTSKGESHEIPLQGQSAAAFCTETLDALADLGIQPAIDRSLFADDRRGTYDEAAVDRYWRALAQIDMALKQFKGEYRRESSPVQLWPHHFDLAVVLFSGRLVPGADPANPEYADEQMNFGFSTGDDVLPAPYFYATAYPKPDGFTDAPLPEPSYWHNQGWTGAVLLYESLVTAEQPKAMLLDFFRAARQHGLHLMRDT